MVKPLHTIWSHRGKNVKIYSAGDCDVEVKQDAVVLGSESDNSNISDVSSRSEKSEVVVDESHIRIAEEKTEIWKQFHKNGQYYKGIVSYLNLNTNLYRIKYYDGDSEDMSARDVARYSIPTPYQESDSIVSSDSDFVKKPDNVNSDTSDDNDHVDVAISISNGSSEFDSDNDEGKVDNDEGKEYVGMNSESGGSASDDHGSSNDQDSGSDEDNTYHNFANASDDDGEHIGSNGEHSGSNHGSSVDAGIFSNNLWCYHIYVSP